MSLRFHFGFIEVKSISFRFHFNLTLASFKTLANHSENGGTGPNGTGGAAAPREPGKPKYHSRNKGQPLYTLQNPCRKHQGCSIFSQNNFLFDFAKQSQAPSPKGTDPTPRTGGLMTIKKPSDRITHAGTIKISRSELTPQPPI